MSGGHLALHLSHLQREKGKDKKVRELWTCIVPLKSYLPVLNFVRTTTKLQTSLWGQLTENFSPMSQKVHVSSSVGHNGPLASGSREISSTRSARCIQTASGPLQHVRTCRRPHSHPPQSCKTARAAASRERRREPRAAEAAENAASRPLMDRTGWVRGGDRSAGQPMQRSGWIRAAMYIAESFWRSVIVAYSLHRLTH